MTKVLARLAPKTLVPTGEGFGGHVRLEQCDVAYALAGLEAGPAALLRAMWAGDTGEGNMRALYLWAWQEAAKAAVANRWDIPIRRELLRTLAARAVDELVYPQLIKCRHCGGSGQIQPNQHNPNGDCKPCGNTGQANPSDDDMAAMAGVTVQEWRQVWLPRFQAIYAALLSWHSLGIRHVRSRLTDGAEA